MTSFKAIIYNAHLYKGTVVGVAPNQTYKDDARQAALVDHIQTASPDLVGLSEVWASSHADEIVSSTNKFGYSGYAYETPNILKLNPGLVTLAKDKLQTPMNFQPYQALTGWDKYAEKGVIFGEVLIGGRQIHVIQTHTQASYVGSEQQDEKVRTQEVYDTLFPVLDSVLQSTTNPVLLLGDLNIIAGSAEYKSFARQMLGRGMRDAWETLYPNTPGFTYDPATNALIKKFAPNDTEAQRLDYIFYRDTNLIKPINANVLEWKTASGLDVSDHYGLEVDFNI